VGVAFSCRGATFFWARIAMKHWMKSYKNIRYGFAVVLFLTPSTAWPDACSDLNADIVKASVLRNAMQYEAERPLMSFRMPNQSVTVCAATHSFRDHALSIAKRINSQCLSEDKQTNLAVTLNASIAEANSNVGLFCR
jgi:hypothetical protein